MQQEILHILAGVCVCVFVCVCVEPNFNGNSKRVSTMTLIVRMALLARIRMGGDLPSCLIFTHFVHIYHKYYIYIYIYIYIYPQITKLSKSSPPKLGMFPESNAIPHPKGLVQCFVLFFRLRVFEMRERDKDHIFKK